MTTIGILGVDLDGTLCDTTARNHLLQTSGEPNWHAYSTACHSDIVVEGVRQLVLSWPGKVHFISGRQRDALPQTQQWLEENGIVEYEGLHLRNPKDFRSNPEYKLYKAKQIMNQYNSRIDLMIDDHPGVIQVFKTQLGIPGILVQPKGRQFNHNTDFRDKERQRQALQ